MTASSAQRPPAVSDLTFSLTFLISVQRTNTATETTMSSTTTPYIGSMISLVSKSDIRYEGILYGVDSKEATIALAKGLFIHRLLLYFLN